MAIWRSISLYIAKPVPFFSLLIYKGLYDLTGHRCINTDTHEGTCVSVLIQIGTRLFRRFLVKNLPVSCRMGAQDQDRAEGA